MDKKKYVTIRLEQAISRKLDGHSSKKGVSKQFYTNRLIEEAIKLGIKILGK